MQDLKKADNMDVEDQVARLEMNIATIMMQEEAVLVKLSRRSEEVKIFQVWHFGSLHVFL